MISSGSLSFSKSLKTAPLHVQHARRGKGKLTVRITGRAELTVELDGDETWCQAPGIAIFSCEVPKSMLTNLRYVFCCCLPLMAPVVACCLPPLINSLFCP